MTSASTFSQMQTRATELFIVPMDLVTAWWMTFRHLNLVRRQPTSSSHYPITIKMSSNSTMLVHSQRFTSVSKIGPERVNLIEIGIGMKKHRASNTKIDEASNGYHTCNGNMNKGSLWETLRMYQSFPHLTKQVVRGYYEQNIRHPFF